MKKYLMLIGMMAFATLLSAQSTSEQEIIDRIKPVGSVNVAGAQAQAAASTSRSGKDIYNGACAACHAAGVLGAPKYAETADWQPRLDARGLDGIWKNAVKGINAMPAMGACMDCDEDDIKKAIEYMIAEI